MLQWKVESLLIFFVICKIGAVEKQMEGEVSGEYEMKVDGSKAWAVYGTLELQKVVLENTPLIQKIELLQGDGGAGTLLNIIAVPGAPANFSSYKEKYTKVDSENRIKESEVAEGGYLNMGFSMYRYRFQVLDIPGITDKCILKSTIRYALKQEEDKEYDASKLVSIQPLQDIASFVESHILTNHN